MEPLESIHQQCLRTRKIGGWFDHPNRGIIEVSGADRVQFLHNILTNDIKTLVPGTGTQACLLTAQAKIIAVVNVLCFDHCIWLAFDYVLKKQLREAFEKLIIMEKVSLKDLSEELKLISAHGPKAKELLSIILSEAKDLDSSPDRPSGTGRPSSRPPLEQPAASGLSPDSHQNINWKSGQSPRDRMIALSNMLSHASVSIGRPAAQLNEICIIRINLIGEEGFGILFPKKEIEPMRKTIQERASALEIIEVEAAAMEIMRITAGLPKYGTDYDESNIPLECLLDHTISFTKGCFPGQEIIARLDSRGGVGKKLCGLVLKGEGIPKKNDRILDNGVEVGQITSAAFIPILKKTVAMGYIKKGSGGIGHPLVVETEAGQIPGRVEELPFYSSNG